MDKNAKIDKIKFPWLKLLVGDIDLLFQTDRYAWRAVALFAFAATLIFALSGNLSVCAANAYRTDHFCNDSLIIFAIVRLVMIFWGCMFIRNWIDIALQKKKITLKNMFIPNKRDLRILGISALSVVCLAVACLSFYLLYIRVPNPNWKIEVAYFAVVSIGFLVPIIALRFCCYFVAAAEEKALPDILEVWHKTKDNFGKIAGGSMILLITILFVMIHSLQFVWHAGATSSFLQALVIEYIFSVIKSVMIALMINFCYIQYKLLFGSENDE